MRIKTFTLKELLIIKEKELASGVNLGDTAPGGKTEDKKDRTSSGSFSFYR